MAGDDNSYTLTISGQGRLLLPAELRESAGFTSGTRVHVHVEGTGELRLITQEQKLRELQARVRQNWTGDLDAVSELAAERRGEAAQDDADDEGEA